MRPGGRSFPILADATRRDREIVVGDTARLFQHEPSTCLFSSQPGGSAAAPVSFESNSLAIYFSS
jgi:hypothetical protein